MGILSCVVNTAGGEHEVTTVLRCLDLGKSLS